MSARANASRLAGPGIGGLLLAHSGMAAVSALVSLLYFIALVAVLGLRDAPVHRESTKPSLRATLAAGFDAARASPRLAGALWIRVLLTLAVSWRWWRDCWRDRGA
jgi:hypothetical protein